MGEELQVKLREVLDLSWRIKATGGGPCSWNLETESREVWRERQGSRHVGLAGYKHNLAFTTQRHVKTGVF